MAQHDFEQNDQISDADSSTRSFKQYWKTALAGLVAAASIATCIYFPPAALFLSPAVEFLVGSLSFAGIWAGFAAFGAVVAGVATLSFLATRLLLEGVEALVNSFSGEAAPADLEEEEPAVNNDKLDQVTNNVENNEPTINPPLFNQQKQEVSQEEEQLSDDEENSFKLNQ